MLFAGNPIYDGDPSDTHPAGQALKDQTYSPPRFQTIAFSGNRFITETQLELWSTDLSVNPPVISRFAGNEPVTNTANSRIEAGLECAKTQFLIIGGMAAHADGTLVVADSRGGAVLEITNPGAANCQSHYVAGTHSKVLDIDIPDDAANIGDVNGKGVDARFYGVGVLTVDPNKNIFVFDEGNDKIKMIANDTNRTVSTVAVLNGDSVRALTYLKGKIYAVGDDGAVDILWRIADPPAPFDAAHPQANLTEIFAERGHFPEIDASRQALLNSLTSDGDTLITASMGYVWRLSTDGTVLATLGGTGDYFDLFPTSFDLTVGHSPKDWPLDTDGPGWEVWLAFKAGKLYWSGGAGLGKNVVQFSCP